MVKDLTEKLSPAHLIADFCSGEPVLDDWLKRRAWQNEETGATRTFVLCSDVDKRVMGYYSLSTGAIQREAVPGDAVANGDQRKGSRPARVKTPV